MREICFDTETTGLEVDKGDRLVEIYAVVLPLARKDDEDEYFYSLINPERRIPDDVTAINFVNNEDVAKAPKFAEIADKFIEFIKDARLIAHNAPFDVNFINMELEKAGKGHLEDYCAEIVDTLDMAKKRFYIGKSLDSLCQYFNIPNLRPASYINPRHSIHGAVRDSRQLALLYPALKQTQGTLEVDGSDDKNRKKITYKNGKVIKADKKDLEEHEAYVEMLAKKSGKTPNYKLTEEEFEQRRKEEDAKLTADRVKVDEFIKAL